MATESLLATTFGATVNEGRVPGLAAAASGLPGRTQVWGLADVAAEVELDASMALRAYSVAKPFTALAVVQLAREGAFALDDNVNDHLSSLTVVCADRTTSGMRKVRLTRDSHQ